MYRQFMIKAIEREQERKILLEHNKNGFEKESSFTSNMLAYLIIAISVLSITVLIG